MPQPRKYKNAAERQAAYRRRQKQKRQERAVDARGIPTDAEVGKTDFVERIQQAGEDAIEQFFRR